MNYEEMSNWEITKRVVEIRCKGQLIKFLPQEDILEPMTSGVMSDKLKIITGLGREQVIDACNNPSDAWPIIVEHGIGMHKQHDQSWFSSWTTGEFDCVDKNPLRAAMICFLKMKDAENGKH
ncbi:NinX [Vibrio phage 1.091.O._10N.286.52.B12]|nr:NinX [Vibrio phage 1.091.O._10N.286.52.B12]